MIDISIPIPKKDYMLIQRTIKKDEYPSVNPEILDRVYTGQSDLAFTTVCLQHHSTEGYRLSWAFYYNGLFVAKIGSKRMSCKTNGISAHFDVDPTYEQG